MAAGSTWRVAVVTGVGIWTLGLSPNGAGPELKAHAADRPAAKTTEEQHPLSPALELARQSRQAVEQLRDYQATFAKQERVNGQLLPATMHIKFRAKPFSVYLRFLTPHLGREVLYVAGRNNGNLLAHETGFAALAGTVALPPTSPEAMAEGRHPITRIGIEKMVEGVIEQWEAERRAVPAQGDGAVEVTYYHNARLGGTECRCIQTTHPRPRTETKFHRTRLFIDKKTKLPIRVEQYGFPSRPGAQPPLMEEYTYSNIQTNLGLTDLDFDPRNPSYGF